ncbi:MAG TPA: MgtC/SapB family protein [Longimicrobiales bacterium]|nr:MgtC/SapB family protein [Longimicrobiales bacterium]
MEPLSVPTSIPEILWRFVVAAGAGAVLGIPAQVKGRPGGIRTHALVSLGASVFCTTAVSVAGSTSGDLLRVIQGIASAVGFIGGAAVLRGDRVVQGINTAASIWISAAVGIAVTFIGSPVVGILAALVATVVNWAFMELDLRMEDGMRRGADRRGEPGAPR